MIVTLDWLRDYAPLPERPQEVAAALTRLGYTVEATRRAGADTVFELEVPSNRPDLQGVIGVARELAAVFGVPLALPPAEPAASGESVPVEVLDVDLCPRYVARTIDGVRVGPSPAWLVARLEAAGVRPVNHVVDVTNFVLFEWGQPLHAFDLERLVGGRIVVRRARAGERIVAIDGREYELDREMLVIADAARPVAIAGVMGGRESEIRPGTTSVVLESARFHPAAIRRTSRRLGLSTPSSWRFERGVPWEQVEQASRRAAALIAELGGARRVSLPREVARPAPPPPRIELRAQRVRRVLGVEVEPRRCREILDLLGVRDGVPPDWRHDLRIEEDLIEEIARHVGYDAIPQDAPLTAEAPPPARDRQVVRRIRAILCGLGAQEVLTWSFALPLDGWFDFWSREPAIGLRDPRGGIDRTLRRSLVPGLLEVVRTNLAHREDLQPLFEVGKIYRRASGGFEEPQVVALAAQGEYGIGKMFLDGLLAELGVAAEFVPQDRSFGVAGRGAVVSTGGAECGWLAEIRAEVRALADVGCEVVAGEVLLAPLVEVARLETVVRPLARFPAVRRDVAVVVEEGVTWRAIRREVEAAEAAALEWVDFVEIYRGAPVPAGHKSVMMRLWFRRADRTLESWEVEQAVQAIVGRLGDRLGARLRGPAGE